MKSITKFREAREAARTMFTGDACFVGGSLCLTVFGEPRIVNFTDWMVWHCDELAQALAHAYLYVKTPRHHYWELAQFIVRD